MATHFDVNKAIKESKTFRIVATLVILSAIIVTFVLIFNGKHNKIGPIETGIPNSKVDSNIFKDNNSRNQQIKIDKIEGEAVFGDKIKGDLVKGDKTVNYNNQKTTVNNYNKPESKAVLDILQDGNTPNPIFIRKTINSSNRGGADLFKFRLLVYNTGNDIAYNLEEKGYIITELKGKFVSLETLEPPTSNESSIISLYPLYKPYEFIRNVSYTSKQILTDTALTFYFYFKLKYSNEDGSNKKTLHKFFIMSPFIEYRVMQEPNSVKYQELKKYAISTGKW